MKHAREDYNRIQDPEGKIPVDEPVFLLRGQDRFAATFVRLYGALMESIGNIEMARRCRQHVELMEAWPVKKTPDL
jgi:hypothetical protein